MCKTSKRAFLVILLVRASTHASRRRIHMQIYIRVDVAGAAPKRTRAFHSLPYSTIIVVGTTSNDAVPIICAFQRARERCILFCKHRTFTQSCATARCRHQRDSRCAVRATKRLTRQKHRRRWFHRHGRHSKRRPAMRECVLHGCCRHGRYRRHGWHGCLRGVVPHRALFLRLTAVLKPDRHSTG